MRCCIQGLQFLLICGITTGYIVLDIIPPASNHLPVGGFFIDVASAFSEGFQMRHPREASTLEVVLSQLWSCLHAQDGETHYSM